MSSIDDPGVSSRDVATDLYNDRTIFWGAREATLAVCPDDNEGDVEGEKRDKKLRRISESHILAEDTSTLSHQYRI
jgi:hypothetical protein